MNEIASQMKDEVGKRMRNPFLGSFLIALTSTNYKLFFVLSSSKDYSEKFKYIEKTLYPDHGIFLLYFAIIPLIAAMFFTFIWPLLDAEISSKSLRLENRKKLMLLQEERKQPIDRELQANYFSNHDKELEKTRENFSSALSLAEKTSREQTQKISKISDRLRKQALQRMADFAESEASKIQELFSADESHLTAHKQKYLLDLAKKIPHLKKIAIILNALESLPIDELGKRITTIDWLAETLRESKDSAAAFYEILLALKIADDLLEDGQSFDLRHYAVTKQRVSLLLGEI